MTWPQGAVLGVVQGLTEFLPVSSSGHLILMGRVLGWPDQGLAFDAAVHLGTLVALLVYFRREVWAMLSGASRGLGLLLAAATLPAGIAGMFLGGLVAARLRDPVVVAASLIVWGLVMWLADRHAARVGARVRVPEQVGWARGMLVGVAQAIALVPGTSRSGVTIAAGLFSGLDRATAARFAFLLGIPITAAAGGSQVLSLLRGGLDGAPLAALGAGLVTSFLAGLAAVWFLVHFLQRRSLLPFVVYRCALGVLILAVFR